MARVSTSRSSHDERRVRARKTPLLSVQHGLGMFVTQGHLASLASLTAGVPRGATPQPASAVTPRALSERSMSSGDWRWASHPVHLRSPCVLPWDPDCACCLNPPLVFTGPLKA